MTEHVEAGDSRLDPYRRVGDPAWLVAEGRKLDLLPADPVREVDGDARVALARPGPDLGDLRRAVLLVLAYHVVMWLLSIGASHRRDSEAGA